MALIALDRVNPFVLRLPAKSLTDSSVEKMVVAPVFSYRIPYAVVKGCVQPKTKKDGAHNAGSSVILKIIMGLRSIRPTFVDLFKIQPPGWSCSALSSLDPLLNIPDSPIVAMLSGFADNSPLS
ncbi:MAG: hypothetical protein H7829_10910 [Magnetococcus sp. THC-1_WYH]